MLSTFLYLPPFVSIIFVILLGLIIGSFLNVVIFRMPIMVDRQWQTASVESPATQPHLHFNLAWPRSLCPHCGATLSWKENIPLISFLLQKGKCRHCHAAIPWQYPLVEMITATIAVLLVLYHGYTVETLWLFIFFCIAFPLALIDIQKGILPDLLTYALLWCGLLLSIFNLFTSPAEAIIGAMVGYLSLWSIYWIFKWRTGKETMGYGDFKLTAAIGAWVGWQALTLVILFAALTGLLFALFQIARGKAQRETAFAFGPYLALAGGIILVFKAPVMAFFY